MSRKEEKVGELGVHILSSEAALSERLWEHLYNGQDGWQYGETTIKHEKNFSVCMVITLPIMLLMHSKLIDTVLMVIFSPPNIQPGGTRGPAARRV